MIQTTIHPKNLSPQLNSDEHKLGLYFTSYFGMAAADKHIHFAAHAEILQIDPGLDGEAAVGQNAALIVDFEVIHICAIGMDLGPDGVASAMDKIFSVPGLGDAFADGIVDLPS